MYIVNLYNVRWERKYTQDEVAKATKLSTRTINKLFNSQYHDYKLSTLETISKFFKCKIHDILIEVEEK